MAPPPAAQFFTVGKRIANRKCQNVSYRSMAEGTQQKESSQLSERIQKYRAEVQSLVQQGGEQPRFEFKRTTSLKREHLEERFSFIKLLQGLANAEIDGDRCIVIGADPKEKKFKDLARYFWSENETGSTWELMYFIVNDEQTNVPIEKLNPLFGYKTHYRPQGFSMINEQAVANFAQSYGDILGVLKTLERGEELIHVPLHRDVLNAHIDEQIERVSTEHDEMQWRLIRLGRLAKCDIWIPRNDQAKRYEGHEFRNFVLREFHHTLDVPRSVENIDVVWKFGPYSIKSAFEIEHSTSVYSGILRLSDLRAEAPNSNYPLFIVASENRRRRVFDELRRPTFSGPCLRLNEVIKFLGYQKLREIDEYAKSAGDFDANSLFAAGETVPLA